MNLEQALDRVQQGERLSVEQSYQSFSQIFASPFEEATLATFLRKLADRRESIEEITGAAKALREAMVPFEHGDPLAIDTCGTGGDGLGTFNLSTTSALVAASAGAKVVKHGNRSVSSRCGSADLLESAGLALELNPSQAQELFARCGIVFLYAPAFHPAMRAVAPVRRSLGIRTIFNLIGPLCNPGRVKRHLLGVADPNRVSDYASVLEKLSFDAAYVVHGAGGADELTLAGPNTLQAVGDAPKHSFDASALGLQAVGVAALEGGGPEENLEILRKVLDASPGPMLDAVLQNASAALVLAKVAETPEHGVQLARHALESGQAKQKLQKWIDLSQRIASGGHSS